jgi:hypothetical protein
VLGQMAWPTGGGQNNVASFITVSNFTGAQGIEVNAGQGQSAVVNTALPQPLSVIVRDSNNNPRSGNPVWFKLLEPQDAEIVSPAPPTDPVAIEAEWSSPGDLDPRYEVVSDPGASNQLCIKPRNNGDHAECHLRVAVEKDTTYELYARVLSTGYSAYAVGVKVDQYDEWVLEVPTAKRDNSYHWLPIYVNGDTRVRLSASAMHDVYLYSGHSGVKVDKILLVKKHFTPSDASLYYQSFLTADADGIARTTLKLGQRAGVNRVEARTYGTRSKIIFTATGLPADPDTMVASNDHQAPVAARTALPKPFSVTLYDAYANVVPGIPVTFSVISGDGAISATSATTDAGGQASTLLTMGIQFDTTKVKAVYAGYSGPQVVFTGIANTGLIRSIVGLPGSGVGVKHFINDTVPNFIKAQVLDDQGKPVSNIPVRFLVTKGSGTAGKIQPKMTNAQGIATDTLRIGTTGGVIQVDGKVGNIQDTVATDSIFYRGTQLFYLKLKEQRAAVNKSTDLAFQVKVFDELNRAIAGQPVTFILRGTRINAFKFPGTRDTTLTIKTNANGIAETKIIAGPTSGYYRDVLMATCTDAFKPIKGSPQTFNVYAYSNAAFLIQMQNDSLQGVVKQILPYPLIVKMVTQDSLPVELQPVVFTRIEGDGEFENTKLPQITVFTDVNGFAQTNYILGTTSGKANNKVLVTATKDGLTNIPQPPPHRETEQIRYFISAKSSNAASMVNVTSKTLSGTVGKKLSNPVQVKLLDESGNPAETGTVTFRVTSGHGTLNGTADTVKSVTFNNSAGIVSIDWTMGTKAGSSSQVLEASANDGTSPENQLTGSPVRFTASTGPDSVDMNLSTIAATGPVHAIDSDTSKITVTLVDRYGNPVSGRRVHLTVSGGNNNFPQDPIVPTNAEGQVFGYLRSLTSGIKTVRATVIDYGKTLTAEAKILFWANDAAKVQLYSGGGQTGNVGTLLKDSLAVRVTDAVNNPVSFGPVHFEVTTGGGAILGNPDVVSDSMGIAAIKLLLGPQPGENVVRVVSEGLMGSPMSISATGKLGTPVAMRTVSGNDQRGPAGEALEEALIVQVIDKQLMPVAQVPIEFAVTSGNGSILTPQPSLTDAFGYARAVLVTDERSGQTCWVDAKNASLGGSPQRFKATSTAGLARKIRMISGSRQSGFVGEILADPLTVQTTDKYGNAVGSVPVKFQVVSGGATIEDGAVKLDTTNASGHVSVVVRLGQTAGASVIEATSAYLEGSPVVFNEFAQSESASSIEKFGGDKQKGTLGQPLIDPLRVRLLDQFGNPVPGTSISFFLDQEKGTIVESQPVVSDSEGIALVHFITPFTPGRYTVTAYGPNRNVTFTIDAVSDPSPPVLVKDIIAKTYEVYEKDVLLIPLVAADNDNDKLTFEVANPFPPEGILVQAQSNTTATFKWTPGYDQQGLYSIVLRVNDGRGGADSDTISVLVKNLNRGPMVYSTVPAADDTASVTGRVMNFLVDARDPDNDPLTYIWQLDGLPTGSSLPFLELFFNKYMSGSHTVDCFVSDGFVSTSHRWTLSVYLSVEFASMAAAFREEGMRITVEWSTTRETENVGFEVVRSVSPEGTYRAVSREMIPSLGSGAYAFEDTTVAAGRTYYYKIVDVDSRGDRREHGPLAVSVPVPKEFALIQNYPNPFNPVTTIRYHVPVKGRVALTVFDLMGRKVAVLADREHEPGYYTVRWTGVNGSGQESATGMYIAQLATPAGQRTMKMVKLK